MRITYSSNNSGGDWWLTDQNWKDLESAGWTIEWEKDNSRNGGSDRFLGALATRAEKEFPSIDEAIAEWEHVVGMSAYDEGCECCGPPHSFYKSFTDTASAPAS